MAEILGRWVLRQLDSGGGERVGPFTGRSSDLTLLPRGPREPPVETSDLVLCSYFMDEGKGELPRGTLQ